MSRLVFPPAFFAALVVAGGCSGGGSDWLPPAGSADLSGFDFGGGDAAPDLGDPGPPPTLDGIAPDHGDWGTQVTLTGTHFSSATAVRFGTHPASFTVFSATTIIATVPQGVGSDAFTVETPAGSATSTAKFAIPTKVVSFYPTTDVYVDMPLSVYGYSLTGATSVKLGSTAAASFTVQSDTTLVATIDPNTPSGNVHITVVAPGGTATSQGTIFLRCTNGQQCPGSTCGMGGVCN